MLTVTRLLAAATVDEDATAVGLARMWVASLHLPAPTCPKHAPNMPIRPLAALIFGSGVFRPNRPCSHSQSFCQRKLRRRNFIDAGTYVLKVSRVTFSRKRRRCRLPMQVKPFPVRQLIGAIVRLGLLLHVAGRLAVQMRRDCKSEELTRTCRVALLRRVFLHVACTRARPT